MSSTRLKHLYIADSMSACISACDQSSIAVSVCSSPILCSHLCLIVSTCVQSLPIQEGLSVFSQDWTPIKQCQTLNCLVLSLCAACKEPDLLKTQTAAKIKVSDILGTVYLFEMSSNMITFP